MVRHHRFYPAPHYRLDNRTHSHLGYNLFLDGEVNGLVGPFSVAISEKQQQKVQFRIGDKIKGTAWTKMYAVTEYADYLSRWGVESGGTRRRAAGCRSSAALSRTASGYGYLRTAGCQDA